MLHKLLGIVSLASTLLIAGAAQTKAYADPWNTMAIPDPLAKDAITMGLYCLDHDSKILFAANFSCAAEEVDNPLPLQLAINGKRYGVPQGDAKYRKALQTLKKVTPNDPNRLRRDADQPLSYKNNRCSRGLCIHTKGKQKAYACYEDNAAYRLRKAAVYLKSYAINDED